MFDYLIPFKWLHQAVIFVRQSSVQLRVLLSCDLDCCKGLDQSNDGIIKDVPQFSSSYLTRTLQCCLCYLKVSSRSHGSKFTLMQTRLSPSRLSKFSLRWSLSIAGSSICKQSHWEWMQLFASSDNTVLAVGDSCCGQDTLADDI